VNGTSARFKAWALDSSARFKAWALSEAWALGKVLGLKSGL